MDSSTNFKVRRDYRSRSRLDMIDIFVNANDFSSSSSIFHHFTIKKGIFKGILGISNEQIKVKLCILTDSTV